MRLGQLIETLPGLRAVQGDLDVEISLITADSRQVVPGALFVAYRGVGVDGARYVPDALRRGAVAVAGEVARALYVGEIAGVSRALALWTTVLEKALDSAALLLYLAVASALMPLPGWVRGAGWTLTAALIAGGAALWVLARYEAWSAARLAWLEARFPFLRRARPQRLVGVVLASIRLLRQPRHAIGLGLRSALLFALQSSTNAVIGLGMGLHLPFTAYALLYSILQISAIVPLPTSPGRLGVFHYLCVVVLALYGVERDVALAYGLVLHVAVYLPTAVGGPLLLWLENRRGHALGRIFGLGAPAGGPTMEP